MSDETIENEKKDVAAVDSEVSVSETTEVKVKKSRKFGTSFSGLIENYGNGGWLLFATMILTLLIMVGTCLAVFFYSVHGEEKVMVPNVTGKTLTNALFDMQVKELYPKISLRYSDLPGDEGTILEQSPAAGSIVKAYRTINLIVSRGVAIDTMENFVGRNIDDVQLRLKTLFSDDSSVEFAPIIYQKHESAAGTILAQYPEPDSPLNHAKIYFVVSTNNNVITTKIPNLSGMSVQQVLATMEKTPVLFDFTSVDSESSSTEATVTSQEKAGESVEEFTRVKAQFTFPAVDEEGQTAYGIFSYKLPDYPFPVNVTLESSDSEGNIIKLVDFLHPGNEITVPYMVSKNSVLTLYVHGEAVTSVVVQ